MIFFNFIIKFKMFYFIKIFIVIFFLNFIFDANLFDDIIVNILDAEYYKLMIDIIIIGSVLIAI
jgi:hypothetical protein